MNYLKVGGSQKVVFRAWKGSIGCIKLLILVNSSIRARISEQWIFEFFSYLWDNDYEISHYLLYSTRRTDMQVTYQLSASRRCQIVEYSAEKWWINGLKLLIWVKWSKQNRILEKLNLCIFPIIKAPLTTKLAIIPSIL